MSAPQTYSELPNVGASTRLAAISTPSSTAPERNTAAATASPSTRVAARSIGSRVDAIDPQPGARAATGCRGSRIRRTQSLERLVEPRLARVVRGRSEHAVGDALADHEPADTARTEHRETAARVELPPRAREPKPHDGPAREREGRRIGRDERVARDLPVDPGRGVEPRVAADERPRVRDRPPERDDRGDERERRESPARGRRGPRGPARAEGRSGRSAPRRKQREGSTRRRTRGGSGRRAPCGARRRRRRPPRRAAAARRCPRAARRTRAASADRSRSRASRPARAPGRDGSRPRPRPRGARRTGWSGERRRREGEGHRHAAPGADPGDDERDEQHPPGYFADAASPAARPAHSSRPETSSASVTVTPSVGGRP